MTDRLNENTEDRKDSVNYYRGFNSDLMTEILNENTEDRKEEEKKKKFTAANHKGLKNLEDRKQSKKDVREEIKNRVDTAHKNMTSLRDRSITPVRDMAYVPLAQCLIQDIKDSVNYYRGFNSDCVDYKINILCTAGIKSILERRYPIPFILDVEPIIVQIRNYFLDMGYDITIEELSQLTHSEHAADNGEILIAVNRLGLLTVREIPPRLNSDRLSLEVCKILSIVSKRKEEWLT